MHDQRRRDERHHEADRDLGAARRRRGRAAPRADRARTPPPSSASPERTRTRPPPARSRPHQPSPRRSSPPERDTPGISASAWHDADRQRAADRQAVDVEHVGAGRNRSTISMTMPPTMNATRDHHEAAVEHALHELGEATRRRPAPARSRRAIIEREAPRLGIDGSPGDHADDLLAIQPHHREDRAELDHHREDAAGIVEAEQPAADQQVRRRRHRQKLGQPLHDAEQRGFRDAWRSAERRVTATALRAERFDFRCGFARARLLRRASPARAAGACAPARVGALPRQKLTIAAAMKTLE